MSSDLSIKPLYSSSEGNCTLITVNDTHLLIDLGKSCRLITNALVDSGVYPDDVAAIFVTHGHTDHISGLQVFSKKYHTPVFCTLTSAYKIGEIAAEVSVIEENDILTLKCGAEVRALPTPHDINGSVCYRINNLKTKASVAVMTDLGRFTPSMEGFVKGVDAVLLESNYDPDMLKNGPYPPSLKQRISGGEGHLGNVGCAAAAKKLIENGTHKFILGHISPHNNTEEIALEYFVDALASWGFSQGTDYEVQTASRLGPVKGYEL